MLIAWNLSHLGFCMWLCSRCKARDALFSERTRWPSLLNRALSSSPNITGVCLPNPNACLCALQLCVVVGHWTTSFTMWGEHGHSSSWSFTTGGKWLSTCLSCYDAQPESSAEKSLMRRQICQFWLTDCVSVDDSCLCCCYCLSMLLEEVLKLEYGVYALSITISLIKTALPDWVDFTRKCNDFNKLIVPLLK